MSEKCHCCEGPVTTAVTCPYCVEKDHVWCSNECRATGGWAQHEPHCQGVVKNCPADVLVAVPYAWQNLSPAEAWESQRERFPATLIVHERDPIQMKVSQTLIPGIEKSVDSSGAVTAPDESKPHQVTLTVNGTRVTAKSTDTLLSVRSANRQTRSLNDARATRAHKGNTYWFSGSALQGAALLPNQVNTISLGDKQVQFYFCDTLGDIRQQLGHQMEDFVKSQYKFKGLGNGKDCRTFLAVNAQTSDSVVVTVRDSALCDLEFYSAHEPRPVQLQKETYDLTMDERNADDVKALCYAIEMAQVDRPDFLEEALETLQGHLKHVLSNSNDIAASVEQTIEIRGLIVDVQKQLIESGMSASVNDYKNLFSSGEPGKLYQKLVMSANGELKQIAETLYKRIQWRDELQTLKQKKGTFTKAIPSLRRGYIVREIEQIKMNLNKMKQALDDLIRLRSEFASPSQLEGDARYLDWVTVRKAVDELLIEDFRRFPEADKTARSIRKTPWQRKPKRTNDVNSKASLVGMLPRDAISLTFDFTEDQKIFAEFDYETWLMHLEANLAQYGEIVDGKWMVRNVNMLETEIGTFGPTDIDRQGTLTQNGLQVTVPSLSGAKETYFITQVGLKLSTPTPLNMQRLKYFRQRRQVLGDKEVCVFVVQFFENTKQARLYSAAVAPSMTIEQAYVQATGDPAPKYLFSSPMFNSYSNTFNNVDTIEQALNGTGVIYSRRPVTSEYLSTVGGPNVYDVFTLVEATDEFEPADNSESDSHTTPSKRPGTSDRPRERSREYPRVPRAFDPSSVVDRGGERGGGVLFYGMDEDQDISCKHKGDSWYHMKKREDEERDDFDMDW